MYPELIENIRNNMYVDDLVSGGNILSEVEVIKQKSIELFAKCGLNLYKWHSNISLLEKLDSNNNGELTYVEQLFSDNTSNTKIFSLGWNKASDTLFVIIPTYQQKAIAKRNILSYVAVADPLGFISPSCAIGKVINCELCDEEVPWDTEVSVGLKRKIEKWVRDINSVKTALSRSIPLAKDSITVVDLHVYADASIVANCAAVHEVVYQHDSVSQALVTSKLRISKHKITIPRLQLVLTHMGANLVQNVKSALKSQT